MLSKFNLYWLTNPEPKTITRQQFSNWKKTAVFDGVKGMSYGTSFCKEFALMDGILMVSKDPVYVDSYIQQNYVKG